MSLERELARGFEAFARGDLRTASAAAESVLRAVPQNPGALTLVGRLALVTARLDVALSVFTGLTQTPGAPAACWMDLARTLAALRRHDQALAAVERAADLDPNATETFLWLGEMRLAHGDRAGAEAALRRVLKLDPFETAAYQTLPRTTDLSPDSPDVQRMLALLDDPRFESWQKAHLHYGLVQAYKRAGERERFIAHMYAANEMQSRGASGSREIYEQAFDRDERVFTREALARAQRADATGPTMIFIVGMPRSGTTLVEQIIGGDPAVAMGGELLYVAGVLAPAVSGLTGAPWPERFDALSKPQVNALAQRAAQFRSMIANGAPFLTDKTPMNYHVLGALPSFFPGCKIVHIHRDPMDTCFSILQHPFEERVAHLHDVKLLAYYYARYQQLMRLWERELSDEVLLSIAYEDLVSDPEKVGARLMRHCGLDWSPSLLDFHARKSVVHTLSTEQVRRRVNRDAIGAWRDYETELAPLRQALAAEGVVQV